MSTLTSNYNFIKPELSDPADITKLNENWDKIDAELKKKYDSNNKPTATDIGADASGSAAKALSDAKSYTDQKIATIPTPDVSGQINAHNTSGEAHGDIRTAVNEAKQSATKALTDAKSYTDQKVANIPTPDVSGQINTHNSSSSAHADIRELIANKKGAVVYTATIGTSWTENEDTGVKSQNVAISGVTAEHTAKVDHAYTGNGSSDSYATFVTEENQYLEFITNGYAETYNGGIAFHIFGDANTVNIPIVVEVV